MSEDKALRPASERRSGHGRHHGIKSSRSERANKRRTRALYDHLQQGYSELYGSEQRAKHSLILQEIRIGQNDRVLDVGCGDGQFTRRLANLAGFVVGLDFSSRMISEAKKLLHHRPNCETVIGDVDYLPFRPCSIQILTAITVILNPSNSVDALSEMRRVISGAGTSVVSYVVKANNSGSILASIRRTFGEDWNLRPVKLHNDMGVFLERID